MFKGIVFLCLLSAPVCSPEIAVEQIAIPGEYKNKTMGLAGAACQRAGIGIVQTRVNLKTHKPFVQCKFYE